MPSFANNFNSKIVKLRARNSATPATESVMNSFNTSTVKQSAQLPTAAKLDITSSNTADAAAGTGARTIEIYGLAGGYTFQSEILTLNGNTIVQTAKSYLRVFEIAVLTAGSGGVNAGDIYVVKTGTGGSYTGGVPGTVTGAFIKGLAGDNFGQSGWWTAPAGKTFSLMGLGLSSRAQAATVKLYQGFNDNGLFYPSLKIEVSPANPVFAYPPVPFLVIPEKTDLYFSNLAAAANGFVSVDAFLIQQGV